MTENRVIGYRGELPWGCTMKEDMRRFRRLTVGKPVIMGRKTFESIGTPLKKRVNVVLTHNRAYGAPGCRVVYSADEARREAHRTAVYLGAGELMVIGGEQIYETFLPQAQRLYLTIVHKHFRGDTRFPEIAWGDWRLLEFDPRKADEDNPHRYTFLTLHQNTDRSDESRTVFYCRDGEELGQCREALFLSMSATYQPTIGLEVHAHLKTRTKMFCASRNDPTETHPNVNVCPVCLGHPGTLPTINRKAVEHVLRVGLATGCTLANETWFERKQYFYPDLPKGYQISQYERPLCENGTFEGVRIRRVHLEEDAGKLLHDDSLHNNDNNDNDSDNDNNDHGHRHGQQSSYTFIDYNRAGTPLMELVTEPDLTSARDARRFAEELQLLLRYLGVSDADMEKGQMRIEVNISMKSNVPAGLGTKVEIKNLNSFRAVEGAIAHEIDRQTHLLEQGREIVHETRGWDSLRQTTIAQRAKETSEDYRYFPEPDLPLFSVHGMFTIDAITAALPETPSARRTRLSYEYTLEDDVVEMFVRYRALGDFFERAASELREWEGVTHDDPDAEWHYPDLVARLANMLTTQLPARLGSLADDDVTAMRVTPEGIAELIVMLHNSDISSSAGDIVLDEMMHEGGHPSVIVEAKNLAQVSDTKALAEVVDVVLSNNPDAVDDYKSGNVNAIQFLVGQVMKESAGKADPAVARSMLEERLQNG